MAVKKNLTPEERCAKLLNERKFKKAHPDFNPEDPAQLREIRNKILQKIPESYLENFKNDKEVRAMKINTSVVTKCCTQIGMALQAYEEYQEYNKVRSVQHEDAVMTSKNGKVGHRDTEVPFLIGRRKYRPMGCNRQY